MMFELILALTLQTAAYDNPSTVTATTFIFPNRDTLACDMAGKCWPGRLPTCGARWITEYALLAVYPSYQECMQKVARIGESDNHRGICRAVEAGRAGR